MSEEKRLKARIELLEHEKRALLAIKNVRNTHAIRAQKSSRVSEAVVVTLLSDVHYEEEVRPASVYYRNSYTLNIAKTRLEQYFVRVARLIQKEKQDVAIQECILHLGGDFITGRIHEENIETAQLAPIDAILAVKQIIRAGIDYLLKETDCKFTVVCSAGNHSRITKRVHYATEQGNSLEWFMYAQLSKEFAPLRVQFVMEEGYHTYITVFDRVLRFHHGHGVKFWGGVGGLTIPLNKAIAQWNTVYRADYDFLGHHHQHLMTHNAVVNGSMIGYNAFSVAIKAAYEKPKQAFVLLDRDRGLTVSIPIMFSL